jgi:hypothetical protein
VPPVFYCGDVRQSLALIDVVTHDYVTLQVTEYHTDPVAASDDLPQVALDQLRTTHHLLRGWPDTDLVHYVAGVAPLGVHLVTGAIAATMATGAKHMRRTCIAGPQRQEWLNADFAQLDKHASYGMYGTPNPHADVPVDAKVVRPIWTYGQKGGGIFKAHGCINGNQLVRLGMQFEHTYAACIEQHCLRLFMALAAYTGILVIDGNVVNAYAHTDARGSTMYFLVDDVFQEWYRSHYSKDIAIITCVPLTNAILKPATGGNHTSSQNVLPAPAQGHVRRPYHIPLGRLRIPWPDMCPPSGGRCPHGRR